MVTELFVTAVTLNKRELPEEPAQTHTEKSRGYWRLESDISPLSQTEEEMIIVV